MNIMTFITSTKKSFIIAIFAMLSMLLAAYGPMTTYSEAQAVNDANLQALKGKILTELNRRIDNYQATIDSLSVNVHVGGDTASLVGPSGSTKASTQVSGNGTSAGASNDKTSGSVIDELGSGTNFTLDDTGIKGDVFVSAGLKDKVKQFMQKVVDGLKTLKQKVEASTTIEKLMGIAGNIDMQFIVNQLTQVQAAVIQAADSATGVVDHLKEGYNNLQTRVTQLKECTQALKAGKTSIDASASQTGAAVDCSQFKITSEDIANSIQAQLKSLGSIITTIATVVSSVVTLVLSLVMQFSSLTSSLGKLGSLGNLSNLGNMSNLSSLLSGQSGGLKGLSGMAGGGSVLAGLKSSFEGILSQLSFANSMSSNAQNSLSSIAELL